MQHLRKFMGVSIAIGTILAAVYLYLGYAPAPKPPSLSGEHHRGQLTIEGYLRTFLYYVPDTLPAEAPLLFVLHGSLQTNEGIRHYTGYEFERLADQHGFMVVYPQGYKRNWNDCRISATYPARAEDINDQAFFQQMRAVLQQEQQRSLNKVFLAGFSNGGHLGFRFAIEAPEMFAGIATMAANLPTEDNSFCRRPAANAAPQPPIMMVNGELDPINPDQGGEVTLFLLGKRGTVRGSLASATYFAELAGYQTPALSSETQQGLVIQHQWQQPGKPEVLLMQVQGAGHVIPQPHFRAPRILGDSPDGLNTPEAIWAFFSRQLGTSPH